VVRSRYDRGAWERRRKEARIRVDVADRVELPVGAETAWARLADIESVATSLPGLVPGSLRALGGGVFEASMCHAALGVTGRWTVRAEIAADDPSRRLVVRLSGQEPLLGMRLGGEMAAFIAAVGERAELAYRGDFLVEGRLAAAGRPIIRAVVEQASRGFVRSLSEPEPTPGGSRGRRLMGEIKALAARFRRPRSR
jgi:carbon monoxide dehydrogenase subunit G